MKKILTLIPTSKEEITKRKSALQQTVEAFVAMDVDCVRVEWAGKYVTRSSCVNALKKAIATLRHSKYLSVIGRGDHVYIVKNL